MNGTAKFFFHTFGCRVNQYETQALRERLLGGAPAVAVEDYAEADLCVINTCTVTVQADKDAVQLVKRIAARNPAARIVVTGCLATRDPESLLRAAPGALVVGNDRKDDIPSLVGCGTSPDGAAIHAFAGRSRAFVKVQDGCNMKCTYCIIPSVRPELSSKPIAALADEVAGLVAGGYDEVVLCGIRLGRYLVADAAGKRVDFVGMLGRLLDLPGDFRIRLSSLEITDITPRFLELAEARRDRLAPSFHLPLQSGSEAVLKRMKRWYSAAFFERRIAALRERIPDAGIFSDVMVGFPGETEAEFSEGLSFVERRGFSGLHVFRYSRRTGTPAALRTDHLAGAALIERAGRMKELDRGFRRAFAASAVGTRSRVVRESGAEGRTGNFLKVRLDRDPGPGLHWARVVSSQGETASAVVE